MKVPGPPRWSDLIFHSRTLTEPRAFILTELHRNSHNLLKSLATMASEGREGFWQRAYHRLPRRVARPAWTLAIRMLSTAAAVSGIRSYLGSGVLIRAPPHNARGGDKPSQDSTIRAHRRQCCWITESERKVQQPDHREASDLQDRPATY